MERYRTQLIYGYIISNILFQFIFFSTCFLFPDILIWGSSFFRIMTVEELWWFVQRTRPAYDTWMLSILLNMLKNIVIIIDVVGVYFLYSKKRNLISVPKLWKIVIPAVGILIYIPCFYYIKYCAPHYNLYLLMVPTEIFSLVSLSFIFAGKWHERLKKKS